MTTETRPPVEDVIKDMGDDALAETAKEMRAESERLGKMAGLAQFELERRMIDRDATKLNTDHWTGVLRPGKIQHTVDTPRLIARLTGLLTDVEWKAVLPKKPPPTPVFNHAALNELYKRGGAIKEAIDEARESDRGRPGLELKRKESHA